MVQSLRRKAEDIPEQQFNYLLSTAVISGTAFASGAAAWLLWPIAREVVNFIFSADALEARVLQVCRPNVMGRIPHCFPPNASTGLVVMFGCVLEQMQQARVIIQAAISAATVIR